MDSMEHRTDASFDWVSDSCMRQTMLPDGLVNVKRCRPVTRSTRPVPTDWLTEPVELVLALSLIHI